MQSLFSLNFALQHTHITQYPTIDRYIIKYQSWTVKMAQMVVPLLLTSFVLGSNSNNS